MPQYQGVWTLEQQAQAQSNQQWVTDPNFKNTTLLLQADGTASLQNNTFFDGSTNNFFITRNGNTTQGSFSPFSQAPGRWSNYFDGNASCDLAVASTAQFNWGANDFCIEAFVYPQVVASARIINFGDGIFNFEINASGYLSYFQGTSYTASTGALAVSTWTHCVITRQSGTIRMFANGVLVYTNTNTTSKGTSTANIGSFPSGGDTLTGYISNLRVVNGNVPTAYQTSSTTVGSTIFFPPNSPLTAVSGSALLTCQSNYFVDNSGNSLTITVGAGTPSVQAFGPFAPALQWTPDVVGGSGYFDGTGDYLTASGANTALGAGTFTIDGWFYLNGYNGGAAIYSGIGSYPDSSAFMFYINASGAYSFNVGNSDILNTGTAPLNTWIHFTIVRSSTGSNGLALYINGTSIATVTSSTNFTSTNAVIGRTGVSTSSNLMLGYLSGIRVVVGSANVPSGVPTTPPTAITNTQLLLNYTNAGIYDGKMANNLETVGNAQVATSPVKYGSGSMYFDGTGDYLIMPNSPIYDFGTGDFTIEGWVYVTSTSASRQTFIGRGVNGGASFHIALETTGNWIYYLSSNNSTWNIASAVNIGVNRIGVWQHIALVRAGTVFTPYLNGIAGTTTTSSSAIYWSSASAAVNCITVGATEAGTQTLFGFIDDLRITKACRYFANFTPPQQALPRQ